MKILAIETSCDETAIAIVKASGGLKASKFKIVRNLVASQIKIHRPFGGVVPNLAKREHLKNLPILWKRIMNNESRIRNKKFIIHNSKFIIPDLIAVTVGPGLEPALWTGINFARDLYRELTTNNQQLTTKLLGVSHLDGHLYSNILKNIRINKKKDLFPAVHLLVSGGHTMLILMKDMTHYKKLGETVDDAVGEAFDKVARLLKLSYPGGPEIEKMAKKGNSEAIDFPRPMLNHKNYNFSFSGLKTSVLYYIRDMGHETSNKEKADIAASFQQAAFDVLIKKTLRAAKEFNVKSIMISGGVAANKTLAREFKRAISKQRTVTSKQEASSNKQGTLNNKQGAKQLPVTSYQLLITKFPTDNAAMIASAAYINYLRKKKYPLKANGNLNF